MASKKSHSNDLPVFRPTSMIADRPNNIAWLFDNHGNDLEVLLLEPKPDKMLKARDFGWDYNTMKYSGKVKGEINGKVVIIELKNLPFETMKIVTGFGKMIEEANLAVVKQQIEDSKGGDIPGVYVITAQGKLEKETKSPEIKVVPKKPGETKKQYHERLAKTKASEEMPLKEEVEILKEVGAAEAVSSFDGWIKHTIGEVKAEFEAQLDKNHALDYHSGPYFIGMWIPSEQKYVPIATPNEVFEKQYIVVFKKEATAIWLYTALLSHPVATKDISLCAPFPIHNLSDESNDIECIVVTDAKLFLQQIPFGRANDDKKPAA